MSGEHPLYYVVSVPGEAPSEEAAQCVAQWLELSPYDAKMKLGGAVPQILRAAASRGDAVEFQMSLDAAGVVTRCLSHEQIVHAPPPLHAVACNAENDVVAFLCKNGEQVALSVGDVRAIVKARVRERVERDRTSRRTIALLNRYRGEAERRADTTFVLYLYCIGPNAIRIAQDDFDYDFLGGGKSMSSLRNFDTLVRLLRQRFAETPYDEGLCRATTSYEKVKDSSSLSIGWSGNINNERSRVFTDERYVREAAWLIALTKSEEEW